MSIANLQESKLEAMLRISDISYDITVLQNKKTLKVAERSDESFLNIARQKEIRSYYQNLYNDNDELQEQYFDYTQLPEYQFEIDILNAEHQMKLEELANAEGALDEENTVLGVELQEAKTYLESVESMLKSSFQDEFSFGNGN